MDRDSTIEEIRARLESIRTASINPRTGLPFRTDVGRKVSYGKMDSPAEQDVPGINFWDGSEDENKAWGRNARTMTLSIEGYLIDRSQELIKLANDILHDVDSVLLYDNGELHQTMGGACFEIKFIKKDPFMLDGDLPLSGAMIDYQVIFEEE